MSEVTSEHSLENNNEEGQGTEAEAEGAEEEEYEGTSEYTIDPLQRQALNQQLSTIMSIIQRALPENKSVAFDTTPHPEKTIIESVRGKGGRAIRRMLDMLTSKRLANDNTKLVVRVYGIPKLPKKPVITTFLAEFSATHLKKSERSKMYVATLPNYREYDRICNLGSVHIGDIQLQIKPLHLSGPKIKPLRPDFKNRKKNILGSIYEPVQPKKNKPPSNNANASSSKQNSSMDDTIVLDELVESDTNYDDEEMQLDDLEDY